MLRRTEISLKSAGEVDAMREAGRVVARCLEAVRAAGTEGTSLQELDEVAHAIMRDAGAVPAFLDYHPHFAPTPFPGVICASVNDAVVHAIPGAHRLAAGDLLSVDCGAYLDGWCGDAAVSFVVGAPAAADPVDLDLIATTERALEAGIAAARPGARMGDIGAAVAGVARPAATGCSPTTAATASGARCTSHRTSPTRDVPARASSSAPAWSSRSSPCCTPAVATTTSTTPTAGPSAHRRRQPRSARRAHRRDHHRRSGGF